MVRQLTLKNFLVLTLVLCAVMSNTVYQCILFRKGQSTVICPRVCLGGISQSRNSADCPTNYAAEKTRYISNIDSVGNVSSCETLKGWSRSHKGWYRGHPLALCRVLWSGGYNLFSCTADWAVQPLPSPLPFPPLLTLPLQYAHVLDPSPLQHLKKSSIVSRSWSWQ